jgi:adenosylhomocysteine nucleosidase
MLLIAAALEEELKTGMVCCEDPEKVPHKGIHLWQAVRNGRTLQFLKTGVGPRRCAKSLTEALNVIEPAQILVTGYAGALDPELKLGHLVAVERAHAISLSKSHPDWEHAQLDGTFDLVDFGPLSQSAKSLGIDAYVGDTLTSAHVLGSPEHKQILRKKFHASIVDMETAALAEVAASRSIPLSCIRVVSDEARDTFLEPFSHDPSMPIPARAKRLLDTGIVQTYREWKSRASIARDLLSRFLAHYL